MTTLPEGWSPTADVDWGQVDETVFRHYISILVEAYVDGGKPGETFALQDFAAFISERKGADDAYRWIYKKRSPEELAAAERYWRERDMARLGAERPLRGPRSSPGGSDDLRL